MTGGGSIISIFFIIRDRIFKHKNQIFHINQRNSTKYFFARGEGAIFILSFKHKYQYFLINLRFFLNPHKYTLQRQTFLQTCQSSCLHERFGLKRNSSLLYSIYFHGAVSLDIIDEIGPTLEYFWKMRSAGIRVIWKTISIE